MASRHTISADVVIVGGGLGGVAAAIAVCRAGRTAVLTEETDWLGGQLTNQAVPPDEHPWVEQFGVTRSYRQLRDGIRDYYRRHYPIRAEAAARADLNPGAGRVSKLCAEPRVAVAVIDQMLAPHRSSGRLTVLMEHRPVAVATDGDNVAGVTVRPAGSPDGSEDVNLTGGYYLDATETGELLELGGIECVIGAESRGAFGEPHAPQTAEPGNQQGITFCFAFSHHRGCDYTIERPQMYDFWHAYQPDFWPGPLIGFLAPDPRTLQAHPRTMEVNPDTDPLATTADQSQDPGDKELWGFRRILARRLFQDSAFDSDICVANWPLNDYWLKPVIGVDAPTRRQALQEARELSLSVLYWLQTEAPRPDGGHGFPGLRPRPDITGAPYGLAKAPYIRESRRILARQTVTENDVSADVLGADGLIRREHSVGVGSYRIDLHPSTSGANYIDIPSVPFEIPLGALIPRRATNLLPASKNAGTTHVSNGCFRLHPVEWNIGEAAGELATFCLDTAAAPGDVDEQESRFAHFARRLDDAGVERHWPDIKGY